MKSLDFILPLLDSAVGHWRFRGDLNDDSGNEHYLTGQDIGSDDFQEGYTERDITAIDIDGSTEEGYIPFTDATAFDMGVDNFSIEAIFRVTASAGIIISKWFSDESSSEGWRLRILSGKVRVDVSDGTATSCQGNTVVNDGRWHYVAVTVDRVNDQLRIYVDGVEDSASPFDISARTGDFSAPGWNLRVGTGLAASIDEIAVAKEILTATAVARRSAGTFNEVTPYRDDFLPGYLPRINRGNEDLQSFLRPFSTQLLQNILSADELLALISYDECPQRFLSHLASNFGFELIDTPFASEIERRRLLKNVVSIYREKGRTAALQRIIGILGFLPAFTENYSMNAPFAANKHRCWDLALVLTDEFADQFESGNLKKWLPPLNLGSWWRVEYDAGLERYLLYGTGDGTDNDLNWLVFSDSATLFRMAIDYEITGGATPPAEMGLFLRYEDANNWLKLEYRISDAAQNPQYLYLVKMDGGAETATELLEIDTDIVDPSTGRHVFWAWVRPVDASTDEISVGFDSITLVAGETADVSGVASGKKGLWVNRGMTVRFYSVTAKSIDQYAFGQLFDPAFANRELEIELLWNPENAEAKKIYLERIIPNYVPAGVEVTWI